LLLPVSTFGTTEKGKSSKITKFSDIRDMNIKDNDTLAFVPGQSIFEHSEVFGETQRMSNYESVLGTSKFKPTFKPWKRTKILVPERPLPLNLTPGIKAPALDSETFSPVGSLPSTCRWDKHGSF
jgi:hypothetical protein